MYVFIISLSSFNYIYKIPGPLPRLPVLLVLNLALSLTPPYYSYPFYSIIFGL